MEADKCIFPSSATEKNQVTINNLDDDSLGVIFNMLPYIDRVRIESVCQRWYDVGKANWSNYSKRLTICEDFLHSYYETAEKESILKIIIKRSGPHLEEIIFKEDCSFNGTLPIVTIKWIVDRCPKLKLLNTGTLVLHPDDWLACSNIEALSFTYPTEAEKSYHTGLLFHTNRQLRRLEISASYLLTKHYFDHLDHGQLEFLQIEYSYYFEFTAELANKLAESLVELRYSSLRSSPPNLRHLKRLKKMRSLFLKVGMEYLEIEFIVDIFNNCQKLECLFLSISAKLPSCQYVFAPLLRLPYLKRLVIIIDNNEVSIEERDKLLPMVSHLEFFVIDTCAKCGYGTVFSDSCNEHSRGLLL